MKLKLFFVVFLLSLLLSLTACGSGPPPKEFLLEPVLDPVNEADAPSIDAVGMAKVIMPGYNKDERLASRGPDLQIVFDEKIKWAESPDDAVTRVLADRLRYYLEANVVVEPWPRGFEPEARIEVEFDKFLREITGGAEMAGQIRIISGDGRKMLAIRTFQFLRYANSRDANAFFSAASAGINDVSRMVADSLRDHFSPKQAQLSSN